MNVRILTDSEPTLESIASTKQIEMKEKLRDGDITSYQWVSTKNIWADGLTKEMPMAEGVRKLLQEGKCDMVKENINKVICEQEEIKMLNIRNRNGGSGNCQGAREPTDQRQQKYEKINKNLRKKEKLGGQV